MIEKSPNNVSILVPRAVDQPFDYRVPDTMELDLGHVVQVPFGRETLPGIIWGAAEGDISPQKLKSIQKCYDLPPYTPDFREYLAWVAGYTMAPLGLPPMCSALGRPS